MWYNWSGVMASIFRSLRNKTNLLSYYFYVLSCGWYLNICTKKKKRKRKRKEIKKKNNNKKKKKNNRINLRSKVSFNLKHCSEPVVKLHDLLWNAMQNHQRLQAGLYQSWNYLSLQRVDFLANISFFKHITRNNNNTTTQQKKNK